MPKLLTVLVAVVLGGCGGAVVGEPPPDDAGVGCINHAAPDWCAGRPTVGVECAPPHQYPTACEPVPNGPGGEIRYCCNALPDGGPSF